MERITEVRYCPDCKQIPKHGTCDCKDRRWTALNGVPGTEEERAMLAIKGFREVRDAGDDVYY
jgi:ATP sulfurylase